MAGETGQVVAHVDGEAEGLELGQVAVVRAVDADVAAEGCCGGAVSYAGEDSGGLLV